MGWMHPSLDRKDFFARRQPVLLEHPLHLPSELMPVLPMLKLMQLQLIF
jgi:hypothetical protein